MARVCALALFAAMCLACAENAAAPGGVDAEAEPPDSMFLPPVVDATVDRGTLAGFGAPCEDDADCASGYCIEARDAGRLCTQTCGECPAGYECAPIGNAGPDRVFLCVTDQPDLCKPCELDRECDDPADLCLPIGRHTYCGEDCSDDGLCPEGYRCAEIDREGTLHHQCVPADDEGCEPCRDRDEDGYGDGGDCLGPDCDDNDPDTRPGAPERCDGVDNDCNARVDDGMLTPPDDVACLAVGLCLGAEPRCEGGEWRCRYPAAYEADELTCDGVDNDCDGAVDEAFDLTRDVANCGVCNAVCSYAHAEAQCANGRCLRGPCDEGWHDADGDPGTGCEYLCAPTRGGVEACDQVDNDCDGRTDEGLDRPEVCDNADNDCDGTADEGFDLLSDASNCGACGAVCDLPAARARCDAGRCSVAECNAGFYDLDGRGDNGCEYACQFTREGIEVCDGIDNDCDGRVDDGIDTSADVNNCGRCGNICAGPAHRALSCVDGMCQVGDCLDGFVDADGDGGNGCEYACRPGNGGVEACNGADDDCDRRTDEGVLNACGQCGPVPPETCNGVDDDCNGIVDDHGVCGPYLASQCRIFLAWADRSSMPAGALPSWGPCPGADRSVADPNVRCVGTRRDGAFARLPTAGDVNDDDQFAVALFCDDAANPGLAAYMQTHCAVFLSHADVNGGVDNSPSWGDCPPAATGDNGRLRCTSSGYDGQFRRIELVGDVNADDQLGIAWICRDGADPGRAGAMTASAQIFLGWADRNEGPADGSPAWGPCPGQLSGEANGQRCTSSRGDGLYHLLQLGGDVSGDDQFGIALRARAVP
ncbi:MAG: putative metal-binding motif-containing protein [Myxococcales bacterium]|nr:putative metal-binding motif-containing protein [Myxococcales bacterium]